MQYSCTRQLPTGAWCTAKTPTTHWIDSFHTGYNLDSLRCYVQNSADEQYAPHLERGFGFYTRTFFEATGRPRYYDHRAQPIDIQCASQAIETLTKCSADFHDALPLGFRVAKWTIDNMQDATGDFYYRRYPLVTARAPMLDWGQSYMYYSLSLLAERSLRAARSDGIVTKWAGGFC